MIDLAPHSLTLALLVALAVTFMAQSRPVEHVSLYAVAAVHLLGLLLLPAIPGPSALHLGLWDGLLALALTQCLRLERQSVLELALAYGLVSLVLHGILAVSPPMPAGSFTPYAMQGIGLLGFFALALQLHHRAIVPMSIALACGLLGWIGPDTPVAMGLKLALVMSLLRMSADERRAEQVQFEKALVQTANQLELPFRLTAQALFHVPVPILLVESLSRDVIYANGAARSTLSGLQWSRRPLATLFLELHPTGPQQEEGLILEADGLIQRVLLHSLSAPGEAGPLDLVSLSTASVTPDELSRILVEERTDAPGTGRCLTDGRFSIAGATAGWQQLLGRLDRYFHSGSVWDKLRMVSTDAAELIQAELELERSRQATLQVCTPSGALLEIRAFGFRDSRATWWYLFDAQLKGSN
ncbi:MAG: hypothetical protein RLY30_543 [Pseudomonadota bacterium]